VTISTAVTGSFATGAMVLLHKLQPTMSIWTHRVHKSMVLCSVAVAVEFDEDVVGTGGAGFAWPSPADLQEQRLHSISLPPNPPQYTWDSDSDEGSIADVQQDHMEPVVQDTEVQLCMPFAPGRAVRHAPQNLDITV